MDDAHLHALGSLGDQGVAHEAAQGVVLEEEEVEMDMVAGRGDVAEQLGEELITVEVDLGIIAMESGGKILTAKEMDEALVERGDLQSGLGVRLQHRPTRKLVEAMLGDGPLLAHVLSEEEVKDDAHHGQEHQHEHPGHGLGRLAIVEQDGNHRGNGKRHVEGEKYPMQIVHARGGDRWWAGG